MNIQNNDQHGKDDELLEALFKHASSRQRAPRDMEQKIRAELFDQWGRQTRQRRLRRQLVGWAIAASVVLVVLVSTDLLRRPEPAIQGVLVASVEKRLGDVYIRDGDGKEALLASDSQVFAGSELSTSGNSRLSMSWANGESVRMDQNSRLELISETEISLRSGKLYIDSGGANDEDRVLVVQTPSGPVRHIGTRYITSVMGKQVTVSVRDGEVAVGSGQKQTIAMQGQKLQFTGNGQASSSAILTYGEEWRWTELVAPRFNTDGRSLDEFLEWVGRETGREIRYASTTAKLAATQTRMHGDVDAEPLRAMELMLQTSDLKPQLNNGVILVSF